VTEGEILVEVTDGVPRITAAPDTARMSWEFLCEARPPFIEFTDGLIVLCGTVVYRIVAAETYAAVVDLVADYR
jgi:hypothetical protein